MARHVQVESRHHGANQEVLLILASGAPPFIRLASQAHGLLNITEARGLAKAIEAACEHAARAAGKLAELENL